MGKAWLGVAMGLWALAGCDPATTGPSTNDNLNAPASGLTGGTSGPVGGSTGAVAPATGEGTTGGFTGGAVAGGGTTGGMVGTSAGTADAGTSGGTLDGGGTKPSKIAGSGLTCASNAAAAPPMCAGYYCNVSAADVAAELDPSAGPCSGLTAEFICAGSTSQVTASCSRTVKSNPLNALDDDATLRAKIEKCVFEDAAIAAVVSPQCLSCYLDSAQCASDNCLGPCISGDSPGCDECRLNAGCTQTVPGCGGMPSPF